MIARCVVCGSPLAGAACLRCQQVLARPDLLGADRRLSPIGEGLFGLRLALRSLRLTLATPRLFAYWILPLLISLALFIGLTLFAFEHRGALLPTFDDDWPRWIDWARQPLAVAAGILGGLLALLAAALATLIASAVINAPFLERISEAVETLVLGTADRRPLSLHYAWNVWLVPLIQAVILAVVQGVLGIALLTVSLTGVLTPLVPVGSAFLTAAVLIDVVVARKRYPIRARYTLPLRNLPLWLGLALPFSIAPFLLPLGVAGATLAYLRELRIQTRRA